MRPGPRVLGLVVMMVTALVAAPVVSATGLVSGIWVKGNRRVETSAIRLHIGQAEGAPVDEDRVDTDIKDIYAMGFFDNVWVTSEDTADGVVLVYHVAERPYIEAIEFEGVRKVEREDLEAVINITTRTIFDPQRVWVGLEQARKFYTSEGYPDAKIDFDVEVREDNNATVVYRVDEGELVRVVDIRFEGVKAFKKRKLRKLMTTRKQWWLSFLTGAGLLNEDELATDVDRLTAFYYDNGYIHARVDEPKVERNDDGLVVTMKIDEGPLFHIGSISFEGEVLLPEEELLAKTGLVVGGVFRASRLREAVFALTEAYGDLGYAFAEIEPRTRTSRTADEIDIRFAFDPGQIVSIRRIDVRGNTKTRDHVIRRELALHEGEKFSGVGLRSSKAAVRRLGFFEEVELTTNRTERDDEVDLQVQVKEGRTGAFSAGAGFSSADSFLFNARISESNLFGRGQRLVLNGDIGSVRQNFQLSFTEPWFGDRPLSVGFDLFDWQLEFDRFRRGGTGFAVRASYPLARLGVNSFAGLSLNRVRAGLQYRLERAQINGVSRFSPPDVIAEVGTRLTSSVTPTLTRSTLDHPFDPTRGSRQSLSSEIAGLGGSADFWKVEFSGRWFWPVATILRGRELVYSFAANVAYGLGEGGASGKELPVFERYFPGGINSFRGFDVRSMGPRQEIPPNCLPEGDRCESDEIGGSNQLILNNELILPVALEAGVKAVVFFDVGNAFLADNAYDPGEFKYAAGWGVRWLSPFGPLRVEIGYNLNPEGNEDSSVVLFSFGAPF